MARPFPDKFNRETSPLSPQSGGSQTPISYSANVNRQKTKKWVDAKPADYGGDEWGDDYNDYSAPLTQLPNATGLRQPGQAPQLPSSGRFPDDEITRKTYGDLPSLAIDSQARSVTNPVRNRANSFTKDDDRRAFSGGYTQPPGSQGEPVPSPSAVASTNHPPIMQVSTQIPAVTGLRKAIQPNSPAVAQSSQGAVRATPGDEPTPGTSTKYSEETLNRSEIGSPSNNFQTRRDFSPSAVSPPLQTRHSAGLQSASIDSPSSRFPPRKSSISQTIPPEVFQQPQTTQEILTAKPWAEARPSSPGAAARSPTTSAKGLPFIRPADIYRRMEEEREKERQSMDSNRPSMDSIAGVNTAEQPSSPSKPPARIQSSSNNPSGSISRAVQEGEDSIDSGQSLVPILAPIQERKSEYGFDGYYPPQTVGAFEEKRDFAASKDSEAGKLSPEEIRRFSSSPKLPDLNRISGFGLDLFSLPSTSDTSVQESMLKSIPESSRSTDQSEPTHSAQPSHTFTSNMHQALDAGNPSVPDKLPSLSNSNIERIGMESTVGSDVKPNNVPSVTSADNLDTESGGRENGTHSALGADEPYQFQNSTTFVAEVPRDQSILPSNKDTEEYGRHPGRSINHSNISTPSSGNSPVRPPKVITTAIIPSVVEGRISTTPDPSISPVEEDLPESSRPFADRELSFRPNLPGGWTSYATTATNSTTEQEPRENLRIDTYSRHMDSLDAPVSPISESEEDDGDVDLTPTTTKRLLPQSTLGAGASFKRRDREMLSGLSTNEIKVQDPHMIPDNVALPTPDPALALIGNPYATSSLDPRLQDESLSGKPSLAAPEIPGHDTISATSTEPPTPPPKDTPAEEPLHVNPEYFHPTAPLKHKTLEEVAATEDLELMYPPQLLPTLSTQTSPQDEESDKLRKEIIKSLSPKISDAENVQSLASLGVHGNNHSEASTALGGRESTYLPSEYDNYWETTNEAEAEERERAEQSDLKQKPEAHQLAQQRPTDVPDPNESTPLSPPLSTQTNETASMEMLPQRPPLPSNRFSWEAGPEEVSSTAAPSNPPLQIPISEIDPRYAAAPDTQLRQLEQTQEAYSKHGSTSASGYNPPTEDALAGQVQEDATSTAAGRSSEQYRSGGQESSCGHTTDGAVIAATGASGAIAFAAHQANQHRMPERRLSLAEEKNPVNAATYAVSPTPPEDEHPAHASQPTIPISISGPGKIDKSEVTESVMTFQPQRVLGAAKMMQFRDILTLQNPEQRIRAYNDTRDQFATMNIGLTDWLMFLSGDQRRSFPTGPATAGKGADTSNISKTIPSGVPGTPLQQPYYQQYLNASPTSSVTPMIRPGTGITSSSQQGFSPSGSKLSGQQVQTKSKDLLHSAGIFGGKASKAGKGLFAKGKNKLRGSGGGDKDSPPLEPSPAPKPKVNEGRVSSWNLSLSSLASPRSSARASTPPHHSREGSPPPQRLSQLGPRTPQHQSQSLSESTLVGAAGQTELSIWDAPVSAASTPPIHHSTPKPSANNENLGSPYIENDGAVSKENGEEDNIGLPAPIGKHQPSWDPYNATPIVEEEAFLYEEQATKQPSTITPATHQLGPPQFPIDTKSSRSVSEDAMFYDASEQPEEGDDWVIVSQENVPKLSELSFAAPVPLRNSAMHQSNIAHQPGPGFPPTAVFQPPARDQPVTGQKVSGGHQHLVEYQSPVGLAKGIQPSGAYQSLPASQSPPTTSQPQTSSHGGFRGRLIQHIRQRSSKDGNIPTVDHISPPSAASAIETPQTAGENSVIEKRPTEFVGLPPIRRSSTFGLGFRTKDPSKRFTLDDDDEDEARQQRESALPSEGGLKSQTQDPQSKATVASQVNVISGYDNRISDGDTALVSSVIATPLGSRTSPQSSVKPTQAPTETQQRPPLSNVSSEYSRPSSFSPVSPTVSSPVSPPEWRPAFTAGAPRDLLGASNGESAESQQIYTGQDRRQSEADWRPNVKPSLEQRAPAPASYQRPPLVEARQSLSQIPSPAIRPRNPSFEGQRPSNSTSYSREPSFESQRLRSPSASSQGNVGTLPILSSGVFVPPPRVGQNQQKPYDQPPSSSQRYPALFKAEQGGKEASIDGLPAHYYQAPISKEDAFLPRQQTNEYQLPGVGPPPDRPQSGKRNSRRNSALFKELGGRLSRSASRDRDSMIDDDARSAVRPVESRDSQSRDYSTASITSEDTVEKKKRRSGLSFLGALRRESTGGPLQSRESMVTHLPVSRTDSLLQPQPQRASSPLAPPDKRKLFFSNNRGSPDPEKSKSSKPLRASTSGLMGEQTGKKKRFSGITSIFSRPNMDQERRDSGGTTGQILQDPRNNQRSIPPVQGPQYLEYPAQQTTPENRWFRETGRSIRSGGQSPQTFPPNRQDQYLRGPPNSRNVGLSAPERVQTAQSSQGIQRLDSPATRGGQIAQPLPSPSLVNPTLQTSFIETRPVQDRHFSQQYGSNSQSPQNHQRQTPSVSHSGSPPQPLPISQSPQSHQRRISDVTQPSQVSQPATTIPQNSPNQSSQSSTPNQTNQILPPILSHQDPLSRPQQAPASVIQPRQLSQPVINAQDPQNQVQETLAAAPRDPASLTGPKSQSPQSQAQKDFVGAQPVPFSQRPTSLSPSPGPPTEARASYQQDPLAGGGGRLDSPPVRAPQQPQYQQRGPSDPQQANIRPIASPQAATPNSHDGHHILTKQAPAPINQTKTENKQRQGSAVRLFSGFISGRRSSPQQAKDSSDAQIGTAPQVAMRPGQPQDQQQWQQQQRIASNSQQQGLPGQTQQRGLPMRQEPIYAPLPIPGAYNLVRGEGGQLAPTPYDPRGLNAQPGTYSNQQFMHRDQAHSYLSRPPQIQIQPYPNDQYVAANRSNSPHTMAAVPQNTNRDGRPGLGPQQNYVNGIKSTRPLSSEDLVARSPARPQFGQQAPYQLSLPDENASNNEGTRPLPINSVLSSKPQPPLGANPETDNRLPTSRSLPIERALPRTEKIDTTQQHSNPLLRHPLSPATYPLPEHAPFSPINPEADKMPLPPPPKWPQQIAPSQNLDHSNTINTSASEVSQVPDGQLSVPGLPRPKEQEHPESVTPPSPQITPERSPEQVSRQVASPSQEEDVYSASPRNSVAVAEATPSTTKAYQQSPDKILVDESDSRNGRRRVSQEEKILVEEGMVRPGSAEEEIPSMSATSYPGQEWHPYGNGYEEWD